MWFSMVLGVKKYSNPWCLSKTKIMKVRVRIEQEKDFDPSHKMEEIFVVNKVVGVGESNIYFHQNANISP